MEGEETDIDDVDDTDSADYDFSNAAYDPDEAARIATEIAAQTASQGTTGF